jgi:DNA invertase Pin-like site-specific DNA recombinase
VSSTGQSLDVQREKLAEAGCVRVFEEKRSGRDGARPELASALRYVREGDVLVVCKLDRLARSTLHLHQIAAELERDGVALRVLDQSIDTGTPTGRLLFTMLAAIAQFENELRAERQADGIAAARARGQEMGRPVALTDDEAADLRARHKGGESVAALERRFRIGRSTVYRYLKES